MKKCIYQFTSVLLLCIGAGLGSIAQSAVPPPPPVSKSEHSENSDQAENTDQTEIVIRQKGNQSAKITLELKNGAYFINGKPIDQYEDKNVIIEKREVNSDRIDLPEMAFSPSPFRAGPDEQRRIMMDVERSQRDMQREMKNSDMQRKMQKSMEFHMNSAFLGVSSRKAEKGGATVLEVTKGSAAEKAGIKKGDIITKVNNDKIESPESLFDNIHNYKAGEKVKISFMRAGKEQTVTATLDKSEFSPKRYNYNYNFKMPPMPGMNGFDLGPLNAWNNPPPKIGITIQDPEEGKGVTILEVEDSSAAAKAGLKKSDIILLFDGNEVNNTTDLVDQLDEARQKNKFKLKILRGGMNLEIEVKIPRKLKTAEL